VCGVIDVQQQSIALCAWEWEWRWIICLVSAKTHRVLPHQGHVLVVFRVFRLVRTFRLLKLAHFSRDAQQLFATVSSTWRKVMVFLTVFISLTVIVGAVMYAIEGHESGFTSIPQVRLHQWVVCYLAALIVTMLHAVECWGYCTMVGVDDTL